MRLSAALWKLAQCGDSERYAASGFEILQQLYNSAIWPCMATGSSLTRRLQHLESKVPHP